MDAILRAGVVWFRRVVPQRPEVGLEEGVGGAIGEGPLVGSRVSNAVLTLGGIPEAYPPTPSLGLAVAVVLDDVPRLLRVDGCEIPAGADRFAGCSCGVESGIAVDRFV